MCDGLRLLFLISVSHIAGQNGAPETKTVTYHSVSTDITGETRCWLTQNLGADRQALSSEDASEASSGWYWQFNRKQGYKHDGNVRTPATTWVSDISEGSSWEPENDPCTLLLGAGWRIPTLAEWVAADGEPQNWTNREQTYASVLKMHAAGWLSTSSGDLSSRGSSGHYWSSTNYRYEDGHHFDINGYVGRSLYYSKSYAFPLRCIKD